jgi:nucleoside-diphosphate-sugar epimerase
VETMKKILVCGSAGFLISNFMRYVLYRSKDFEFVSVDNLKNPEYYKLVYINKNHKFYVGDVSDKYFMDRIINIENPEVIINGVSCGAKHTVGELFSTYHQSIEVLMSCGIPVINLSYPDGVLEGHFFKCNYNTVTINNGTILELPNCFGWRQKTNFGFAKVLKNLIINNVAEMNDIKLPWAYAEDVASYLWYIVEKQEYGKILKMPILGKMSIKDMVWLSISTLDIKNVKFVDSEISWSPYVNEYVNVNTKWVPDSSSVEDSLQKTVRWYSVNKWMFNLGEKND